MNQTAQASNDHFDAALLAELRLLTGVSPRPNWPDLLGGQGEAPGHFGELYQGAMVSPSASEADHALARKYPRLAAHIAWQDETEPLPWNATRTLLDLSCAPLRTRAGVCIHTREDGDVTANADADKCIRVVKLVLAMAGLQGKRAHVLLQSNIPPAKGCGSSSADVTAVWQAIFRALGVSPTDEALSLLLVFSERASNPVHLRQPCLFAQRRGRILRPLGAAWPAFHVLGFDPGGTVRTEDLPPLRYTANELRQHCVFIEALSRAIAQGDAATVARIAATVARADDRLPHDHSQLASQVKAFRAGGYAVSHSGVVAALLWPRTAEAMRDRKRAMHELRSTGTPFWAWST
ncbi:hypothetical protein LJR039_007090 [Pseudorhodoferax sp. LjRoot39]|uniref:GHMP family kinase ATP-binding protein n=1 Tax=Pseudorhodoferax sp. LjRoot39 TaxID=3342328 RepID=UPI003ECDAD7E